MSIAYGATHNAIAASRAASRVASSADTPEASLDDITRCFETVSAAAHAAIASSRAASRALIDADTSPEPSFADLDAAFDSVSMPIIVSIAETTFFIGDSPPVYSTCVVIEYVCNGNPNGQCKVHHDIERDMIVFRGEQSAIKRYLEEIMPVVPVGTFP